MQSAVDLLDWLKTGVMTLAWLKILCADKQGSRPSRGWVRVIAELDCSCSLHCMTAVLQPHYLPTYTYTPLPPAVLRIL